MNNCVTLCCLAALQHRDFVTEELASDVACCHRGDLLSALLQLDKEDDVNKVLRYFSYEHFYVIYCKVRMPVTVAVLAVCLAFVWLGICKAVTSQVCPAGAESEVSALHVAVLGARYGP